MAYERVLRKLHKMGLSKKSMHWMRSYLIDRSQQLQVYDQLSEQIKTVLGVRKGSLLDPIRAIPFRVDVYEQVPCFWRSCLPASSMCVA